MSTVMGKDLREVAARIDTEDGITHGFRVSSGAKNMRIKPPCHSWSDQSKSTDGWFYAQTDAKPQHKDIRGERCLCDVHGWGHGTWSNRIHTTTRFKCRACKRRLESQDAFDVAWTGCTLGRDPCVNNPSFQDASLHFAAYMQTLG